MKKILISQKPWETRTAITRDNRLQNIYFASHIKVYLERCFYKGIVTKVLPGIQTAFVEFGQYKAGFLHISEIDHNLALSRMSNSIEIEDDKRITSHMDISKILKEGEPILVQVSKEPVYEKGAKLTRCFTLPGRFIVLMPNIPRVGISKKIEAPEERQRLKDILRALLPEGMGAIIRTSCEHRTEKELAKDVDYLVGLWKTITDSYNAAPGVKLIHTDLPLSLQTVRDNLDDQVTEIITDNPDAHTEVLDFLKQIAPEYKHLVKMHKDPPTLFEAHNIEKQLESALEKKTTLRSGGSIIIESTEAMTVVDVNTGKFVGKRDLEDTILQTNLEAAEEIVRQLRLRNIGGLIVIDFIDMGIAANRQKVFKNFEQMLKEHDKFQSVVLRISEFGLVQMTRKRSGKTLVQQLTSTCEDCCGRGFVNSIETDSHNALRKFTESLTEVKRKTVRLILNPDVFEFINHSEHDAILELEKKFQCQITLESNPELERHKFKIH